MWRGWLTVIVLTCLFSTAVYGQEKIKVLVWDEQQPEQKQVYDGGFLGEHVARYLQKADDLQVKTASIKDPEKGLSTKALQAADVLVYWSHKKQRDISQAKGKEIAELVKAGKLGFLVLHSAHWSVTFMSCMQEKAAQDALARLSEKDRKKAKVIFKGKMQWRKRKAHSREAGRDDNEYFLFDVF